MATCNRTVTARRLQPVHFLSASRLYRLSGLCIFVTSCAASSLWAQVVEVRAGNVYYSDRAGRARQITFGGTDSSAALSPDGEDIVFVRSTSIRVEFNEPRASRPIRDEIWVAPIQVPSRPRPIFRGIVSDGHFKYATFFLPRLSTDRHYCYFLIAWAAVENAVVKLDIASGSARVISPAVSYYIVGYGAYGGDLVVQKRKSYPEGSTYFFYLISPDGADLGFVGETDNDVREFLRRRKIVHPL